MSDENGQGDAAQPRKVGKTQVDDGRDLGWAKDRLTFPVGDRGEDPDQFTERVVSLLNEATTAVYVDTSFAMWITKASKETRDQFKSWMSDIAASVHVPVWTYHEYYRHHQFATLKSDFIALGNALNKAAREFVDGAKTFSDQSLSESRSAGAYVRELTDMLKKVEDTVACTQRWDYEGAVKDVSSWLSNHLCRSRVVFDLMQSLGRTGETRYTQDLPPGFMDRIKKDEDEKGSNRFGDLILWEEVIAHVPTVTAKTVVILTKDRKVDWFAKSVEPTVAPDLLRMHPSRWRPVPAPHPTLSLELAERTCARNLILLDELYSAAVLWKSDRTKYAKLIGYAARRAHEVVNRELTTEVSSGQRKLPPPLKMLALMEVAAALKAATDPPSDSSLALLAPLHGANLPDIEDYVQSFDAAKLNGMSTTDIAAFSRLLADAAIGNQIEKPASDLASRLLTLLPEYDSQNIAAVLSGFAISAYKDQDGFRTVPKSWDLQRLFDHLLAPEVAPLRAVLKNKHLKACSAFFVLKKEVQRLTLDIGQAGDKTLEHATLGNTALLDSELGPTKPLNLRKLLGRSTVTAGEFRNLVIEKLGIPESLVDMTSAKEGDELYLPEKMGLLLGGDDHADEGETKADYTSTDGNAGVDRSANVVGQQPTAEDVQTEDDADDAEDRAMMRGELE